MTEIWLILGINVAGLACALGLSRWLSTRDAGTAEVRRVGAAIERASLAFVFRQYRLVAVVVGGLLGALVITAGLASSAQRSLAFAAWGGLGTLFGALSCCLAAHFGVGLTVRGSLRTLAAARVTLDRTVQVSVSSGGALAVSAEALSGIGVLGLFALAAAIRSPSTASWFSAEPAVLLAGYGLGALGAALSLQRSGATYHAASDLAADLAGERDAALDHDDPRNPAVISDLVGDHVGHAATRAVDQFATATSANVAMLLMGAALVQTTGEAGLLGLPLLVRAFGLLGSCFGLLVVRSDEDAPLAAFWRGQAATSIIVLGGLAGAAWWLLGGARLWQALGCGSLGLLGLLLVAHASRLRIERRLAPMREALDALKVDASTSVAHGAAVGLQTLGLSAAALALVFFGAWHVGDTLAMPRGGVVGVLLALGTMLAGTPFTVALGAIGPIADNARGIAAMAGRTPDPDLARRIARLDDAAFVAGAVARVFATIVGGLSALLLGLGLPLIVGPGRDWTLDLTKPMVMLSAAAGAGAVLAYVGALLRSSVRAAKAVALEVERQLGGFPRERGVPAIPREFTPSYRACIDLTEKVALQRVSGWVLLSLLLPVGLGAGLGVLYRSTAPGLAAEALAAFAAVAAVTGLGAALAAQGTCATLTAARRQGASRESSTSFRASVGADALADLLGNAAAPAAHLIIKATAVAALAAVPFLN